MFGKPDLCLILGLIVLSWTTYDLASCQLIKPLYVYGGLIKSIRDYFSNICIILLHNNTNPMETLGLVESERLLVLQKYLSMTHLIRTTFMDFHKFRTQVGQNYNHIKRPLFVLLNDHEDTRDGFAYISTWITMSYPTWLVFFNNETELTDFFFKIYIPFDCKFMVVQSSANVIGREIITEVYQVDRGKELRSAPFGVWDVKNGLKGPERHGLYFRRNNLFGQNIRVTSVHDPPISTFHYNERNEITNLGGYFGELMLLLQETMNCTFTYKEAKTWGICLNGSCSGAIGMLLNKDIDFAATEFIMNSERLDVVSLTTPIYTTKRRAYIKRSTSTNVKWNAYTAPFSMSIWGTIAFFIVLMSGSIIFIQRLFAFALPYLRNDGRSKFTEILFLVLGAFCNQGMAQSTLDPLRMVQFVIHSSAVVIIAAYSAALISFLAISTFTMPFTTMDGLLTDGTYGFGVIGDSADYSFFLDTSDKTMKRLFNELLIKETDLPPNYLDGLKLVCKDKYAFMMLDNMIPLLQQKVDCKLEPLDVIMQVTIAMALQSKSPYRGIINANLLLLKDSGILQRLLQLETQSAQQSGATSSWKSVEINDIVPLLFFVIAALFISFLICALERVIFKSFSNRIKLRVNKPRLQPWMDRKMIRYGKKRC